MVRIGDKAKAETRFGPFGDSANLEIIFDAPDGTLM
jgi:hypothetical protein